MWEEPDSDGNRGTPRFLVSLTSHIPHPLTNGSYMLSLTKNLSILALVATPVAAQSTNPYVAGLRPDDVAVVGIQDFAQLPDIEGVAARMMLLAQEPGTRNLFVNDMRGPLYRVSPDGRNVTLYVNIDDP